VDLSAATSLSCGRAGPRERIQLSQVGVRLRHQLHFRFGGFRPRAPSRTSRSAFSYDRFRMGVSIGPAKYQSSLHRRWCATNIGPTRQSAADRLACAAADGIEVEEGAARAETAVCVALIQMLRAARERRYADPESCCAASRAAARPKSPLADLRVVHRGRWISSRRSAESLR